MSNDLSEKKDLSEMLKSLIAGEDIDMQNFKEKEKDILNEIFSIE